MGFPTSPTNGQQVTLNYVTYQYDSSNTAWYRVSTSVTEPIGAAAYIQANAAFDAANTATDTWVRSAANSASSYANSAYIHANAAYTKANTGTSTTGFDPFSFLTAGM